MGGGGESEVTEKQIQSIYGKWRPSLEGNLVKYPPDAESHTLCTSY